VFDFHVTVSAEALGKITFFVKRVDEVADVVSLYTILLLGMDAAAAYDALLRLDAGAEMRIRSGADYVDINVITPMDEVADRCYGFDLSDDLC
jgi:hypothetical protein